MGAAEVGSRGRADVAAAHRAAGAESLAELEMKAALLALERLEARADVEALTNDQ
jgi:hypothetical protein